MGPVLLGLVAGAAGTTALDLASYLDMVVRGRPASSLPAEAAGTLAAAAHLPLGSGVAAQARKEGLGGLLGAATGLAVGAAYGLVRVHTRPPLPVAAVAVGAAAMAASDLPMTALGLTDPRTWPASAWLSDAVPHLAYGVVTAGVLELLMRPRRRASDACGSRRPGSVTARGARRRS
jgi:hypothetical protein